MIGYFRKLVLRRRVNRTWETESDAESWPEKYEAEKAARLDLQGLAYDECARADLMRGLLLDAREYVSDALDAYEHSDGRDLLTKIDATLSAGASK